MKRLSTLILLAALFSTSAFAGSQVRRTGLDVPNLKAPTEKAVIHGSAPLEFRWDAKGDQTNLEYYDFRLYKGHKTLDSGLFFKEKVSRAQSSIQIPADKFEDGQTYTWSVKQIGTHGNSRSAYIVFTVSKQA